MAPSHPYTRGLLCSLPDLEARGRLQPIPGMVPDLRALPAGCRFRERCGEAEAACATIDPRLTELGAGHRAACVLVAG